MAQERKLPLAEIKAGLKLAKEAYNVLASDTDYVKGIRYHLERVDAALQSGNLEMILYCNQQVVKDNRSLLVRNHVEVVHSPSVLREKGLCWNFFNLRVIGHLLANEIVSDNLKDGTREVTMRALRLCVRPKKHSVREKNSVISLSSVD